MKGLIHRDTEIKRNYKGNRRDIGEKEIGKNMQLNDVKA
jgi:hypothetical protein